MTNRDRLLGFYACAILLVLAPSARTGYGQASVGQIAPAGAESYSQRDYGIIKTDHSSHAKLRSVDLEDVRWTAGFWATRFDQTARITLPQLWKLANALAFDMAVRHDGT